MIFHLLSLFQSVNSNYLFNIHLEKYKLYQPSNVSQRQIILSVSEKVIESCDTAEGFICNVIINLSSFLEE